MRLNEPITIISPLLDQILCNVAGHLKFIDIYINPNEIYIYIDNNFVNGN